VQQQILHPMLLVQAMFGVTAAQRSLQPETVAAAAVGKAGLAG
jgi:hypothetical protein